jgi:hypothetical protein
MKSTSGSEYDIKIANALRKHTSATMQQISKFLHLGLHSNIKCK